MSPAVLALRWRIELATTAGNLDVAIYCPISLTVSFTRTI